MMLIFLLFLVPLLAGQPFIPIEKDFTTIAPPVAHGNRATFFRDPPRGQFPSSRGLQRDPGRFQQPQQPQPAYQQIERQPMPHQGRRKHHRKHEMSPQEAEYLRQLEANDAKREEYKEQVAQQRKEYYQQYFDRMRVYAIQTHIQKYNQMLAQQQAEREKFSKTMKEFGVREEDVLRQIGPDSTAAVDRNSAPSAPF